MIESNHYQVPKAQLIRQLHYLIAFTGTFISLYLGSSMAVAQMPSLQTLFVNPVTGNDSTGNGSQSTPFKTITKALQIAQPNNVIILSSGTYSSSSGETFPLFLKPGISIQGDPYTKGRNITIQGGGSFLSPTFARQDITILGANQAQLTGVTVTNPHPRGYGLWLESSSPVVIENTFTGNTHDGISMTGASSPTIRRNYFYQNGANGITIYGSSQPQVQDNVFEQTGYGINIAQQASPVLVGNRLSQNRAGILAQADSHPILRGNVIENSIEDGVVAITSSQPNLGTPTEPGGNIFRQNGRYDISSASNQIIPAFGNQLNISHTIGKISVAGAISPVADTNPSTINLISARRTNVFEGTSLPSNANNPNPVPIEVVTPSVKPISNTASFPFLAPKQLATQAAPSTSPVSVGGSQSTEMAPITIDVPPPESTTLSRTPTYRPPVASVISVPTSTADTLITPPPTQTLPVLRSAPVVESELLPVPNLNIPVGRNNKQSNVALNPLPPTSGDLTPPLVNTALERRYRVVVEATSESEQAKVRSLVPDAFLTSSQGRVLMQAGIYSDRANASEMQQLLSSNGLKATIEEGAGL